MAGSLFKPLRKPEETILTNDEYIKNNSRRKAASELLSARSLGNRFESLSSSSNILTPLTADRNFRSYRNLNDYVCGVIHTQLVSDEAGRVADILLTVPPYSDPQRSNVVVDPSDERHLTTLIALLYSANVARHFTMLCQPDQLGVVEGWFRSAGIDASKYTLSISTFSYSIWAQDAYVALQSDGSPPILCEGVHFPRYADPTIADDVAAQTNKAVLQSYLYFQGGNILEVGDYILVGKDYIVENLGRAHLETEAKVISAFSSLFGKQVISLGREDLIPQSDRKYLGGGYFQPIFHIDMYVTPTGKKASDGRDVVTVGSPRLGRQAIGEESTATDFDVYFDEVADQLGQYFAVERMPLLPARIKFLTKDGVVERYYYLSFNNSVVENFGEYSNVFLPTFSQDVDEYINDRSVLEYEGTVAKRAALDQAAKAKWEELGFIVHQMDGLEDLAIGWGSVHCITKTLVRDTAVGATS